MVSTKKLPVSMVDDQCRLSLLGLRSEAWNHRSNEHLKVSCWLLQLRISDLLPCCQRLFCCQRASWKGCSSGGRGSNELS
jgi:hypothetical protein